MFMYPFELRASFWTLCEILKLMSLTMYTLVNLFMEESSDSSQEKRFPCSGYL